MPFPTGTSRRRALTGVLLALGLTVASSACNSGNDTGGTPGTIKIGLLASLSGTYEAVGTEIRDGFELYLRMHDGKLGGHKVDLIVADEGNGAQTAVPAATKLIKQDRVQALTGIVGGGSVAGVAPVLAEAKIPFVGSNGNPGLKDVSRSWFTSYLSDETGAAIAEYVRDNVKGEVFAIGPNYQGGYDQLRGFTDTFKEVGGKLANPDGKTLWTPFPQTTNFLPYFAQIKASGAEAVYTFYAGSAAVDFVKQYAQSEIKDLPLYAAGFLTEGGVLNAQGEAARNIYSVLNYSPDLDNAENRSFVAAWKENHDGSPTTYAMASYDAAAVLDKAIGAAGDNPTAETINKAIAGLGQIDSPRGTWQFSKETHSPVQKWYLRQVRQDGRALSNTVVGDLATVGG
ncbi:ABC transporter substrate-binding protein [Plantactinospora mayteni]|uniref:Branched chain amino acid ABC transporter substrate-binding protein n=1 Tax=Plantactinospora mayteni TaxID=566021 RepID=A0ABQ4EWK1_9ACTN|nr:ABC transporter substrate-binding protein [Plantactinospora mayteni]GIG99048.1 branched chain amino acid ABC transporter substrate-binding protein [Plantactinospora mayteni]